MWRGISPIIVLALLALTVLIVYAPIVSAYFLADDFNYIGHLLAHARNYVQGDQLGQWFVDFSAQGLQNPDLSVFFRPVVQWLWLTDFIAWGLEPAGYHVTNLILHTLNSFLIYVLMTQVLDKRQRGGALLAGLLFALHPIHSESVAWIPDRTDILSSFFYFASVTFFALYRRREKKMFAGLSVIAFALALGTKENTAALPILLLAFDRLFMFGKLRWKILLAQIPYWLVLAAYVGARFLFLGQFGRNTGGGFLSYGIELFLQFYTQALAQPFVSDINMSAALGLLALALVGLIAYRRRAAVWFGAAWIAISLLPSASAAYVAPRLAYAPSAGLAIALAAMLVQPFATRATWARALSGALIAALLVAYSWGLSVRVADWAAAGAVTNAVRTETLRLFPTLPDGATVYYLGVPEIFRNIYIYNENLDAALRIAYRNPSLRAQNIKQFPIVADNLDHAFFVEYSRRKLTERIDIRGMLQARAQCRAAQAAVTWNFARADAGWQAWNQIDQIQIRDGAMWFNTTGDDPNLASPLFDVSALNLDHIEIEMRVRASAPIAQGALLWMTSAQSEFSPAQRLVFPVQTDGVFHTYRVNLAQAGSLLIGDHVVRLRLDPAHVPAEIALKEIRMYTGCNQATGAN